MQRRTAGESATMAAMNTTTPNALLQAFSAPHGLPPFGRFAASDFQAAFEASTAEHRSEVEAIAGQAAEATFDNTIRALDDAGAAYKRVAAVFWNLTSSETSPELQAAERTWAPKLAAHDAQIYLNAALFARIEALLLRRGSLGLGAQEQRLLERLHLDFVRAGAKLTGEGRARYAAIVEELAGLYTQFSQNVLAEESNWALELKTEADLAGLPDFVRQACASAAEQRKSSALGVVTLNRSLIVPFLSNSDRRDLREHAYNAWLARGGNPGAHDNTPVIRRILVLRREQAALHGHGTYSEYQLADTMAQTPAAVHALLQQVWQPAKALANRERAQLQAFASEAGQTEAIEPWDWRYWAEKVRARNFAIDDAQIKPYFSLEAMTRAMLDVAGRLFGVAFKPIADATLYHPDVRAYEVLQASSGQLVGVFLADNFSRASKRGGAWMSAYREQAFAHASQTRVAPIIVNNNNFAKAPAGQPTLLSGDDVRTLFHEFGHGLHGLLSNVRFQRLAGTSVLRDFVELPSQLLEHWAFTPEVLKEHARHVETGAPLPQELMDKMHAARRFNQGFDSVEYTSSALVDLALHQRSDADTLDLQAFEAEQLEALQMPQGIRMRHRLPHFGHLFSGDGYASAYYVYLWAETLDADAFGAFDEAGDVFDAPTAQRLHEHIYSAGGSVAPQETYRAFRGRDPDVKAMLRKRGLLEAAT